MRSGINKCDRTNIDLSAGTVGPHKGQYESKHESGCLTSYGIGHMFIMFKHLN